MRVVAAVNPNRRLPPLSPLRLRRLRARIPIELVAREAGIPFSSLAMAERLERSLTPEQAAAVDAALSRLEAAS